MKTLEEQQALARRWGTRVSSSVERAAIEADRRVGRAIAARTYEQKRLNLAPYNSVTDEEITRRHERWRSTLTIVEDPDVGKPPGERLREPVPGFRGHSSAR